MIRLIFACEFHYEAIVLSTIDSYPKPREDIWRHYLPSCWLACWFEKQTYFVFVPFRFFLPFFFCFPVVFMWEPYHIICIHCVVLLGTMKVFTWLLPTLSIWIKMFSILYRSAWHWIYQQICSQCLHGTQNRFTYWQILMFLFIYASHTFSYTKYTYISRML